MRLILCTLIGATVFASGSVVGAQQGGTSPTYKVYPIPVESPDHTTPLPPADARELLTDPSDATASPFGWHDDDGVPGVEYTTTQGNNALVFFDANTNGIPDPDEFADGGSELVFDFTLDLENPPFASADAVLTNLFYWSNAFHDILYQYGFEEAAGNAQENNYSHGGAEDDPLLIAGRDNSSGVTVSTPPDGASPRIIISLLDTPPFGAIALNNWTTVHLLAHTLSMRLTGGPGTTSCLSNAEQMGEGWSDWYGLMFTMLEDHTRLTPRLEDGFRPAPYTTDFAVNGYTYGDTQILAAPFDTGFVWATILWETTWDLIDAHGFDPELHNASGSAGNLVALQLVTEAMKLQPCSPGFVDSRDAILSADQILFDGAYEELLWNAFARRGLGLSADQGSSNSNADNVEAFDSPFPTSADPVQPVASALTIEHVAPNPADQATRVSFSCGESEHVQASVFDVRGRLVSTINNICRSESQQSMAISTSGFAAGLYVLRLETAGATITRRFAVAH